MPTQGNVFGFQTQDIMGGVGLQGTDGSVGCRESTLPVSRMGPFCRGQHRLQYPDACRLTSIAHGKHFLKFGVQFNYESVNFTTATAPPTFTFDGRLSGSSWADLCLDCRRRSAGRWPRGLFTISRGIGAFLRRRDSPHPHTQSQLRFTLPDLAV